MKEKGVTGQSIKSWGLPSRTRDNAKKGGQKNGEKGVLRRSIKKSKIKWKGIRSREPRQI